MQHASVSAPKFTRLANATRSFSQRHWRLVVVAMLALLHVAVFRGVADPWARGLLLAHLGLLLLWQPLLPAEQRVSATQGFILMLLAFGVMMALDWWLLALWVVVLTGLVGGKVYQQHARWQRRAYLVVFVYLLMLLALIILPEIAPRRQIDPQIRAHAEYVLPLAFVLIAFFPAEPESGESAQVIDFFYSVFLMLLLLVVILGTFTFMTLGPTGYLQAITYTAFLTAAGVLLVGLAWNPGRGFAGMNVFFSRYLFSIGMPVERWLQLLADLLQVEARPERFLVEAATALARLPTVSGVAWRTPEGSGETGERTAHTVEFQSDALALTIHSRYRVSPALHWHLQLLGQLLAEFYTAKLREEELRQASYLQAVHETGARMTHDIKNLLQSLNVLCAAAAREGVGDAPQAQALLRRQLPLIAQRLSETLDKLQRPRDAGESYVAAQPWWNALARRYRGEEVEFEPLAAAPRGRLPRTLFDSVADNLIRNALAKKKEGVVDVKVSLTFHPGIALRVRDTGKAVPAEIQSTLLRAPVNSKDGLGIGLYQAARLAESAGYTLTLESNVDGNVCFALLGG